MSNNNRCAEFCEMIFPYLEGKLSGNKNRQLEQHLHDCKKCREKVFESSAKDLFPTSSALWSQEAEEIAQSITKSANWTPEELSALTSALTDRNVEARRSAAEILKYACNVSTAPALIEALADEDAEVRKLAVEALGELEDISNVSVLMLMLRNSDWAVRRAAVMALGKIGASAVPALKKALNDKIRSVRQAAQIALEKIKFPVLSEECPMVFEAASFEKEFDDGAASRVHEGVMKIFPYKRVSLKLQSDLENVERILITLEVKKQFREELESKGVRVETQDGEFLFQDVIRFGKAKSVVEYRIKNIKKPPKIYYS